MDNVRIDPLTKELLNGFVAHPKHAVMLDGESGVGTFTVAQAVAVQLISHPGNLTIVQPEKGTITIDTVRTLYAATRSSRNDAHVIIVDDADSMGREAQNALLKLLEEPPLHVYFILTTHAPHKILDTIRSRVEHIRVRLLSQEASKEFIRQYGIDSSTEQAKFLFLAGGKPAELYRLIHDANYYEASGERMRDARKFIEGDAYERLVLIKKYVSDRTDAESLLIMIGQLLSFSLYRGVSDHTVRGLDAVTDTLEAIAQNGNIRAQLLRLSDQLS